MGSQPALMKGELWPEFKPPLEIQRQCRHFCHTKIVTTRQNIETYPFIAFRDPAHFPAKGGVKTVC